ncbi:MAG: right-handed parallel beta-helix repeat-containing protein [Rikenellaceae bacterium]
MKSRILPLLLFTLLHLVFLDSALAQQHVYLSPDGSDAGDGTSKKPYQTLNKALEGNLSVSLTDTLFVEVEKGDYFLESALVVNTPSTRPIVIRSKGAKKANFIGGLEVKGWEECGNGLYRAYVPKVKQYGFKFEQFFVNGLRATVAQTPNKDWFIVKSSEEFPFIGGEDRMAKFAMQRIDFEKEDMETLKSLSESEKSEVRLRFYHKWDNTQKITSSVNIDSSCVFICGQGMKRWNPITTGSRCIMFGYKAALDVPGEWYLDQEEAYVYYMPREGEDMASAQCIAPTLKQWVVMTGKPDQPIKNISFENVSFGYSSLIMPHTGNEPMQAAAKVEAAIEFDYVENVNFTSCDVQHTGGYAIWYRRECHNNTIEKCYVADLGAGGIKIGETVLRDNKRAVTSHNVVNNTIVTNVGSVLPCGVGIAILHASDNRLTHNDISNLKYSGVSVGWLWGYNENTEKGRSVISDDGTVTSGIISVPSPAVNNTVMYNHIHHIGWGELSDMGAVYTLGESPGTKINNNVIHDVLSYDYGGWGLYTDEGSSYIEMCNNLVYRCKSGGFHQHYGKDNKIENNILAYSYYYQVKFTRAEEHNSFSFKHNIILQDKGETLAGVWEEGPAEVDYNLYWHTDGELDFFGKTFDEWRKFKEPHSVNLNPGFKDVLNDDYTFASTRAAKKIKFVPFDYSTVGVYGCDEWIEKAKLSDDLIEAFKYASATRLKKDK